MMTEMAMVKPVVVPDTTWSEVMVGAGLARLWRPLNWVVGIEGDVDQVDDTNRRVGIDRSLTDDIEGKISTDSEVTVELLEG